MFEKESATSVDNNNDDDDDDDEKKIFKIRIHKN